MHPYYNTGVVGEGGILLFLVPIIQPAVLPPWACSRIPEYSVLYPTLVLYFCTSSFS
jgi:hypothetical protein